MTSKLKHNRENEHPDLMTFICELDPNFLEMYEMCMKMNILSQSFRKLSYYSLRMHGMVTSRHMTQRAVTPMDPPPYPKTPCYTKISWLYLLYNRNYGDGSLHCGNRNFGPFCSCDLDLDLMTFICELDAYRFTQRIKGVYDYALYKSTFYLLSYLIPGDTPGVQI